MPSCAAPNCTNSSNKGSRLFRFPKDEQRRNIWIENCKREQWSPTPCSVLCEGHFEETQFELHRLDGWKKLRPNAIPTIFGIANPPKKTFQHLPTSRGRISMEKLHKERLRTEHSYNSKPENDTDQLCGEKQLISFGQEDPVKTCDDVELISNHRRCELKIKRLKTRTRDLQRQNLKLTVELSYLTKNLQQFLTNDQITHLKYNTQINGRKGCIIPWDEETLCSAQNLFLALGKRGYQYLRDTGYPMPSRRTLIRHRMVKEKTNEIFQAEVETCKSAEDMMENICSVDSTATQNVDLYQNINEFTLGDSEQFLLSTALTDT